MLWGAYKLDRGRTFGKKFLFSKAFEPHIPYFTIQLNILQSLVERLISVKYHSNIR